MSRTTLRLKPAPKSFVVMEDIDGEVIGMEDTDRNREIADYDSDHWCVVVAGTMEEAIEKFPAAFEQWEREQIAGELNNNEGSKV